MAVLSTSSCESNVEVVAEARTVGAMGARSAAEERRRISW